MRNKIKNRITPKIRKLVKDKRFLIVLSIAFIFGLVFSSTIILIDVYAESFSECFVNENYTPEKDIDAGWYDAVETFWDDALLTKPMYWLIYNPSSTIDIQDTYNHKHLLYFKSGTSTTNFAQYYFSLEQMSLAYLNNDGWINYPTFEFYMLHTSTSLNGFVRIYFTNSEFIQVKFENNGWIYSYDSETAVSYALCTYSASTWYYFRIWLTGHFGYIVEINYVEYPLRIIADIDDYIGESVDYLKLFATYTNTYMCFDALNYYWYRPTTSINPNLPLFYSQIQNIQSIINQQTRLTVNMYPLDDSKVYSLYDSIISEKADIDNNYRNMFITDNFLNSELLNCSRVLRMKGTSSIDKKYKVIQLYFDDLDNSDAFTEGLNQSINIRFDTFDNSDNLINKFYANLNFTDTEGYIYWYWFYRESIAVPRWEINTHNPNFKFSDYLNGQSLKQLEVDFHAILTYNSTNMLLIIRTTISFNLNHSSVYTYDKIIDAGLRSEFYGNQDNLRVRYIDYFNRNNGTDYLGNREYTYNNLAGLRTLQVNNTQFYFNFLDVGFFTDVITFPQPPNPPPEPDDLTPTEPAGYFWYYNSISIAFDVNHIIEVGDLEWNFPLLSLYSHTSKYPLIWVDSSSLGNWGFWGEWNWLRDGLVALFNVIIASPLNLLGYVLTLAWNYIVIFLVVGGIGTILWNVLILGVAIGITWLVWAVWSLLVIIYETVLVPAFEWFIDTGLPLIIAVVIIVLASVFASLLWIVSLGTANWVDLFNNIVVILDIVADTFVELFGIFILNIGFFLSFSFLYIYFTGLLYCKYIYVKARGYNNRADDLKTTYETYASPIRTAIRLIQKVILRGD